MSTLAPYSFCLTTSGAIQYGVPTIVARLDLVSVNLALKPKSAETLAVCLKGFVVRTDFDFSRSVHEQVIRFDITVDDGPGMKML